MTLHDFEIIHLDFLCVFDLSRLTLLYQFKHKNFEIFVMTNFVLISRDSEVRVYRDTISTKIAKIQIMIEEWNTR